jgi:hypothetical protein
MRIGDTRVSAKYYQLAYKAAASDQRHVPAVFIPEGATFGSF